MFALVIVAWGASISGPFHFDDYLTLVDPLITSPTGWLTVWQPVQSRPLSQFTFWLSYWTAGGYIWPFHLFNLVLHAACVWLLYRGLRLRLDERASFLAAALFAIHPMVAEPVNYVFARSSQLSTFFCIVSLYFWLEGGKRRWAAVGAFAVALLAKEESVAFPIFLAAVGWRTWRKDWKPLAAMLALALAFGLRVLLLTKIVTASGGGFASKVTPVAYFTAQGFVILRYLRLLVVPWGFTADAQIDPVLPWLCWAAVLAIVFLALRYGGEAGLWFVGGLILLAPSSSIFPADDLSADRRMYLPLIAIAPAAAMLASRWNRRVVGAIAMVLIALSIARTYVWNSEERLWREAVERAPDKVRPRIQLARSLPPAEAVALLESAGERFPDDPDVPTEEGRILIAAGRPADALRSFGRALAIAPGSAQCRNNRGVALAALGQTSAAKLDFERALDADPCFEEARRNLAKLGVDHAAAKACPVK